MTDTESKIYTIEHREPEESDFTLDGLGFADWCDDVRDEIMRIVVGVQSVILGREYSAADAVAEIQEGIFGDTVWEALRRTDSLDLIGQHDGIIGPVTVTKIRRRIMDMTGESERSVIRRTRGLTVEQAWRLLPYPDVPIIDDDLRARHDAAILACNVNDRALKLWVAADFAGEPCDYFRDAHALTVRRKPRLVA